MLVKENTRQDAKYLQNGRDQGGVTETLDNNGTEVRDSTIGNIAL